MVERAPIRSQKFSTESQRKETAVSHNTGNFNIALGFSAGSNLTIGNNNIDIGARGVAAESATIRIGTTGTHANTYMAGVSGVTVPGGVGVIVDAEGHLGTVVSSKRFKDEIKPMDESSEAILSLKPVTFRYKHELDSNDIHNSALSPKKWKGKPRLGCA